MDGAAGLSLPETGHDGGREKLVVDEVRRQLPARYEAAQRVRRTIEAVIPLPHRQAANSVHLGSEGRRAIAARAELPIPPWHLLGLRSYWSR